MVEDLLASIGKRVCSQRMEIISVFDDFCGTHWAAPGHVTRVQFSRAMDMLGFKLSAKQLEMLCEVFCDTELENEFNYVDFCTACDPTNLRASTRTDMRKSIQAATPRPAKKSIYGNPYFDRKGTVRPLGAEPCHVSGSRKHRQKTVGTRPLGMTG